MTPNFTGFHCLQMKFTFCGGLDCPDWILAEIAAMSSISAIKVKQISLKVSS